MVTNYAGHLVKPQLTPPAYEYSGTIVVTDNDIAFHDLADFLVSAPGREDKDDGFYMMNINQVLQMYNQWLALVPRVRPFYAVKCNPDPVLMKTLYELGTGFDCASKGEIKLAIDVGVEPRDIIYAHTCKKTSHISFAADCGVKMMTFDCQSELHKMKDSHPDGQLLLRFRPTSHHARYDVSGNKFGASLSDCNDLLVSAKKMEMNVVGVSFHVGSECFDALPFEDAIQTAKVIFDMAENIGFSLSILDIGGGFPGKESEFPFDKICEVVNSALDKHFPVSSGVRIIAEPGRYFSCSPYTLVANITTVKEFKSNQLIEKDNANSPVCFTEGQEKGYMYYIDDGIYSSFSEILFAEKEYKPKPLKESNGVRYPSCVWGQTLDTTDLVNKNCLLPQLSVGDWVYFDNMGAYTSAICNGFNGFLIQRYTYYVVTLKTWKALRKGLENLGCKIVWLGDQTKE